MQCSNQEDDEATYYKDLTPTKKKRKENINKVNNDINNIVI